jgi:uncharacterized protein YecE (DUF72 family)
MVDLRIGISGWTYAPWRGTFYPEDLKQKDELRYAASQLNSIEINGTFYMMQKPPSFAAWHAQTPEDFVFAIKGGRYITHMRKLKDVGQPVANFFACGILRLGAKLGPILWQMPPVFRFDADRIERFFDLLPRSTKAAEKVAKRRDAWMKGRDWLEADADRPLRYAMEVRHESFRSEAFVKLLRKHDVALCVADTAGKWPYMEDVTSDFVYCRLHGDEQIYVSGYTDAALDAWAARVRAWAGGSQLPQGERVSEKGARKRKSRDVYVYFDNDVKVRAPFDAMGLARRLGLKVGAEREVDLTQVSEEARTSWPAIRRRKRVGA